MPLPDLNALCVKVEIGDRLCITLPGGTELCAIFPDLRAADPSELVNALLAQANSAMAPLVPFFNVLDVIIALVACVKAVQKAIASFPPRPDKLAKCFPQLARALAKLLKLIPQLTIPVLVGGLLDALIAYLAGIRTHILTIIRKIIRVTAAQTKAGKIGSVSLSLMADCALSDIDAALVNMNANAKPIGRLIQLINLFLQLAGQDPIPDPSQLGTDAQKALAPIDATIKALTQVRKGFP